MSTAAAVYSWISMTGVTFLILVRLAGQPPTHCQYLVPVKAHPGVYGCSEYPRVRVK